MTLTNGEIGIIVCLCFLMAIYLFETYFKKRKMKKHSIQSVESWTKTSRVIFVEVRIENFRYPIEHEFLCSAFEKFVDEFHRRETDLVPEGDSQQESEHHAYIMSWDEFYASPDIESALLEFICTRHKSRIADEFNSFSKAEKKLKKWL